MKRSKQDLTPRQKKELRLLAAKPDKSIDLSDIPEIGSWEKATMGRFYRPVKKSVTMRLDADVIAWFKSRNPKYQTAVNHALREYIQGRMHASE